MGTLLLQCWALFCGGAAVCLVYFWFCKSPTWLRGSSSYVNTLMFSDTAQSSITCVIVYPSTLVQAGISSVAVDIVGIFTWIIAHAKPMRWLHSHSCFQGFRHGHLVLVAPLTAGQQQPEQPGNNLSFWEAVKQARKFSLNWTHQDAENQGHLIKNEWKMLSSSILLN